MKKNIFLILILAGAITISAADKPILKLSKQNNQRISDQLESIVSKLDKSQIHTGILYNKIIWYEDISLFDGGKNIESADYKSWRQLYYQIYRAHVKPPEMPDLKSLEKKIKQTRFDKIVPIAILDYKFNKFKEDAFETGLLKLQNNQIIVTDASKSPYQESHVFAAAALTEDVWDQSITFKLDRDFIFSNRKETANLFEIDFADGSGFRAVKAGQTITVNYSSAGEKNIQVRSADENNILNARFNLTIQELDESIEPDVWWENEAAAYPYLDEYASYDAYVFYGKDHSELIKPIVFSEGFDFDNELRWQELYEMLDRQNFITTLREQGYDVIILNWHNPTDYIQRNSLAFMTLIERVLELKSGNEPIIVGGASMGGLVGRYTLALMEQQGKNHQSRLFISFDSPQNGANIPLGVQSWVEFFSDYDATAKFFLEALNSIGARQMLFYHHLSFPEQNQYKLDLQRDLNDLNSYPQSRRLTKLAVSNGSGLGLNGFQLGYDDVPMQPGSKIINWRKRNFWVDVDGDVWALPNRDPRTRIFEGRVDILGPDLDAIDVYVQGTEPYDNAPGGWRSTQEQIAEVSPRTEILGQHLSLGDIKTDFPRHSFIPVVSALDLTDVNGKQYHIYSDLSADTTLLQHTPFDDIFYAQGINEEHVDITVENSAFLLKYINFIDTILVLDNYVFSTPEPIFRALDSILTQGDFIIAEQGNVELNAGKKIILKPGFHARAGTQFYAHVGLGPEPELRREDGIVRNPSENKMGDSQEIQIDLTPKEFALLPNYPNPFNPATTINIQIAEAGPVKVTVYDSRGRMVKLLSHTNYQPGSYSIHWDASDQASGIYYIRLQARDKIFVRKSILLK